MSVLEMYGLILLALIIIGLVWHTISDGDLSLMWAEKFGRSIGCLGGKVVWITGASSGIGEHLAYELASAGCKLVLSARRTEELERVKKHCLSIGNIKEDDVLILTLDVLNFDSHHVAVDEVLHHFGKIDILMNNAGRSQRVLARDTSLEVDQQALQINTIGPISLTKAILPHFLKRKQGCIAVTSSLAGKMGAPMCASYAASKFALHGWFETARIEFAADNINICMVCPGPVFSDILQNAFVGDPVKTFKGKMSSSERRVTSQRCAFLMGVALANDLDEVWICKQPILLICYLFQYMPAFAKMLAKRFGSNWRSLANVDTKSK